MGRGGQKNSLPDKVPVTLLCGFLGSGKTTLLKHILETKHEDEDFKAAVIVNDMAELNIDKSLIDQTSLIQSEEDMVGMQNGCICCTLQDDLVEQMISLIQKKKFNYILIEASGVSEPHEIAPLFEVDDHEHDEDDLDHAHDHSKPRLGEVARLDTCVTLLDSADFYNNLGSMETYDQCNIVGTIPELMMDQVEFANTIIVNKADLVKEEQINDIIKKVELLNPKAKIVKTVQSKIDLGEILNTSSYKNKSEFHVSSVKREEEAAAAAGKTPDTDGRRVPEACTARFDIKSFVYRARKPFHPGRLSDLFLDPYFADPTELYEPMEEENNDMDKTEEEKKFEEEKLQLKENKKKEMQEMQAESLRRQKKREDKIGQLLRSKGFVWLATSHDVMGSWQQAGNVCRITADCPWLCLWMEELESEAGPEAIEAIKKKDMYKPDGGEYEYKDRRQEIVFIGHNLNQAAIEELLNKCLLDDEEMALGPDCWEESMEEFDKIQLSIGDNNHDDDMDEEDEDDEVEAENDYTDDNENEKKQEKGTNKRPCETEDCEKKNKKPCKSLEV